MSRKRHKKARKMVRTLVDIIIPVYNLFDILQLCLDAIPEAVGDIPYRIIIYDNGSVPKDADEFYRNVVGEKILIIRDKENRGFPYACNKASRRGSSPFVFFLNSDVILEPDSLHILIEKMLEDSKIGVAGMKLLFPEDSIDANKPAGKIQHAGLVTNIRGEFRHVFIGWSADHPKVNAISDIHAVTGAALMVRRDVWTKCKGFLEEYGGGTWEDIDMCLTVRSGGFRVVLEPKAVGYHYTNATAMRYNIGYPMDKNKKIFLGRWGERLEYTEWSIV